MTLQPDDPRRPGQHDGAGDSDPRPLRHPQPSDPDDLLCPGGTTEPWWVLPAIALGLLALTGSLLLWVLVGVAGLFLWVVSVPPAEPPEGGRDPFGHPLGGPFGGGGIVP